MKTTVPKKQRFRMALSPQEGRKQLVDMLEHAIAREHAQADIAREAGIPATTLSTLRNRPESSVGDAVLQKLWSWGVSKGYILAPKTKEAA